MISAIVLINAEVDRIPEVAQAIAELDGVSEVYSVAGDVDLIAMVRVRDHEDLADVIADRLNKVDGVTGTRRTSRSAPTPGTTSRRRSASVSTTRSRAAVPSSPGAAESVRVSDPPDGSLTQAPTTACRPTAGRRVPESGPQRSSRWLASHQSRSTRWLAPESSAASARSMPAAHAGDEVSLGRPAVRLGEGQGDPGVEHHRVAHR